MRQRLLMLLAVLLTGGMLLACGPGDDTVDDTVGGGGGVVDEPLNGDAGVVGDPAADDPAADLAAEPAADDALGDDALGDDAAAAEETIEMDVGGDAETTEDPAAADQAGQDAAGQDAAGQDAAGQVDMDVETEPADGEQTDDADGADAADGEDGDGADAADGEDGDVAGGGAAAPAEGETVIITFSQAGDGVAVDNVEGAEDAEAVAATDQENPDLNLTMGQRYEFVYDGDGDLVFFNEDNEPVLSTSGSENQFADDAEANVEADDGRMSFTLTEQLAEQLDHYVAGPSEVGGNINAN